MTALTLANFDDPEREYQDVCRQIVLLNQQLEHTSSKNKRLREIIIQKDKEIEILRGAINE